MLYAPILLTVLLVYTVGVTLLVSATLVYLRDLRQVLPLAIQLGLFLTPIAYGIDVIANSRPKLLVYCFLDPSLRSSMAFDARCSTASPRTGACWAWAQSARSWPSSSVTSSSRGWRWALPTLPEGTIRTVQLWKRFRADRRARYLQDELGRLAERLTGRRESDRWRWALQGIDLAVEPGSSVGLIGVNGSGKTTLLKIINEVMYPTVGRVETKVASAPLSRSAQASTRT